MTLIIEVLRDYLAAVVTGASTSQTSIELAGAMRRAGMGSFARSGALLAEVDLIKFARRPVSAERAAALGREARAIAQSVHQALTAAEKTAKAGTAKAA